jgi:hypothetical protein
MAFPHPPHDPPSQSSSAWHNNYHRPNFPWVCGQLAIGEPCWTGPTPQGTCGCPSECHPVMHGETWACNRPQHRGGRCSAGPTASGQCCQQRPPCVPVRSWRCLREQLSLAALCISVGLCLLLAGIGKTYDVITPGPLSSAHAQRLSSPGNDRCASCHPQAHASFDQWIGGLLGAHRPEQTVTQSDLCMNCHERDLCSEHALVAHNVSPQALAAISARVAQQASAAESNLLRDFSRSLFSPTIPDTGQRWACATCHREHHGQQIDMKSMTDQQCQTCHGQSFHRFELDHPEFRNWPRIASSGIRFNHRSHHFQHFPQGNRPFECSQCHRDDPSGHVQQLVPFEQACGPCHQGPIELSLQGGWALFQLPSLDVQALQAAGMDVGQWPLGLAGDFDGRLSPLSEMLLMADLDAASGLDILGHDFDFLDLDPTDSQQVAAASQVAWGLKRLMADLSSRGPESVRQRLQIVMGQTIDDARLRRLTQNFSPTLFQDSARYWFPQLWQEVRPEQFAPMSDLTPSEKQQRGSAATAGPSPTRLELPQQILARLLQPNDQDGPSPVQSPTELLSENPLAGIDRTSAPTTNSQRTQSSPPAAAAKSMTHPVGLVPENRGPTLQVATAQDAPDLLAENPLANYRRTAEVDIPGLIQSGPRPTDHQAEATETPANPPSIQTPPAALESARPMGPATLLEPNVHRELKPVGWVRNDTRYSIDYHVQGHADPWLKEWIDLVIQQPAQGRPRDLFTNLVDSLTAPDKAGNCLQCHGEPPGPQATATVNWTATYRDPALKGWTKFNHRPHTLLPGLADCRSCHQLRELEVEPRSGENHPVAPDFHRLSKSHCASCHQAGSTSNSCTTCHNYHIGQRVPSSN